MNGPKGHYTPPCLVDQTNGGITPNWEIEEMAEQGYNLSSQTFREEQIIRRSCTISVEFLNVY